METLNPVEIHHEHKTWLNKLDFYRDELKIMRKRLEEVAGKNTDRRVLALIEQFQNQLIVQNNNLDEIRHEVKQYENRLEKKMEKNFNASMHKEEDDYVSRKDEVISFERVFNELRKEIIQFFAHAM